MADLAGKVAVVTGASKGIGAAIAKRLAEAGASVVVNYASSKEGAARVVSEITGKGGKAILVQGDVAKEADVKRLFGETHDAFGQVDVLVNNAGVFKFQPLEEMTEAEYHRQFNINVLGTLLSSREALGHFPASGGSIINISSIVAVAPPANSAIYSATKGAVDTITIALSKELAGRRIQVNAISPGAIETEGTHHAGIIGSDFEKAIVAQTPLGRIGQTDDIAGIAVFLASDDARWLTGERILASGGFR